jgi:hypothetical protein
MKLPPKPQGQPPSNNINYKLPPKPVYGNQNNYNPNNRSYDQEVGTSRSR